MSEIKYFDKPDLEFEEFVKNSERGSVSQSFYWGKLQETVPSRGKFWALAVLDKGKIVGSCVLIRHSLGKRCYLYAHRGPVISCQESDSGCQFEEIFAALIQECDKIAEREKAVFLRIDPAWYFEDFPPSPGLQKTDFLKGDGRNLMVENFRLFFDKEGFQPAHAQYQPLSTLQLDLTKSLDELRAEMRSMGKRNLKKAEGVGLKVLITTDPDDEEVKAFDELNKITTDRDGFYAHNIDYYQRILRVLGQEDVAYLYGVKLGNPNNGGALHADEVGAQRDGKLNKAGGYLAMALCTFYGKEAVYYYGASSNDFREFQAPYLLQWEMIKEAKKRGCTRYDFLGIGPDPYLKEDKKWGVWLGNEERIFDSEDAARGYSEKEHSFAKITFFKTRWGGERRDYVGAFEKVYDSKQYKVLLFLKKLRKAARKLGIKI